MVFLFKLSLKINSLRTGFEPVRVTPSDFESDALTTRPHLHLAVTLAPPKNALQ